MAVKTYKPITPAQRYKTSADFSVLTKRSRNKKKNIKVPRALMVAKKRSGGRNVFGRTTVFCRGGGHKRRYRLVDFLRAKKEIPARVQALEYDPNRSTYIALICYKDGEKAYILAPLNLKEGDSVIASDEADIQPGNNLRLGAIPPGTLLHNLEVEPGRGGKLARSAGGYAQLMAKDGNYAQVKLPSGEIRKLHINCRASIGQLSNTDRENISYGKAGRRRWLGRRPSVRGVAMNPVDHPMGGGEGRSSGGHPRSAWGKKAKGLKTRKNKRTDAFIVRRRKSKKR